MTEDTTTTMTPEPLVGASVWEQQLFDHLISHIEREKEALQEYAKAAEETDSKAFAYVVGLLRDDERRHHLLFASLAESLKTDVELGGNPSVPHMDFNQIDRQKVRDMTRRLLQNEEDDVRDLKRLQNLLHDVKDTTLWDLIVGLMRRDTDKHIAMLEFVLHHAK